MLRLQLCQPGKRVERELGVSPKFAANRRQQGSLKDTLHDDDRSTIFSTQSSSLFIGRPEEKLTLMH